jgi:hypothetical protein
METKLTYYHFSDLYNLVYFSNTKILSTDFFLQILITTLIK